MPSENVANRLPPDALEAFLDGILAELRDPADPVALNEIRAAFRKRVPFNLRSYAAAALILRAAGISRMPAREQEKGQRGKKPSDRQARQPGQAPKAKSAGRSQDANADAERPPLASRPRFAGEGLTLFFSMGKRQRFYPRILIDLLIDVAKLAPDAIGEVRAFDNYSFADIDPQRSSSAIAALDGYEFRGRKLTVGPAKKRDGQAVAD